MRKYYCLIVCLALLFPFMVVKAPLMLQASPASNVYTINTFAGTGGAGYTSDGGVVIAAQLSKPTGIAIDNLDNIYIADNGNNRIRKIDKATSNITTIAGIAGAGTAGYTGDGGPQHRLPSCQDHLM